MTILNYPVKRSTLAKDVYKISKPTFKMWLEDIGINHSRTLSPADVRKIIEKYELPSNVQVKI